MLAQDAAEYARLFDVTVDQAARRLLAQEETVAFTDRLQAIYAERLAGIAIRHQPAFEIVVLLAGDAPVAGQVVQAGGMAVPVRFETGAPASRAQLTAALAMHQAAIAAALPHPPGMGIDLNTGEIVVIAQAGDIDAVGADVLTARLRAIAGVPVRVRAIERPALDLAAEGGARVMGYNPADGRRYACTTGFVVTDGTRTGIATAAHCPDALSYVDEAGRESPLSYVGQWGWGFQDVQINTSAVPLAPLFFADTAKRSTRSVSGHRALASTRAGDFVCHRGERTGYSCATVELVEFAPAGALCGGACTPTWVTVAGPNCRAGDSGAPVFEGSRAFGIVKGGSYRADGTCAFYFYMSTDYLPNGWRLLGDGDVVSEAATVRDTP